MAKPHGKDRGVNLSHQQAPFKTIQRNLVTSMEKNQVKVSFQDHPPNVSKVKSSNKAIEPPKVHKKGSSFQDHYGSFKTILDGSKKDTFQDHFTSFKTIVNRVTSLNPQYMVPANEATLVISDPKSMKKVEKVAEQPSSGPPPPGSWFNPIYISNKWLYQHAKL